MDTKGAPPRYVVVSCGTLRLELSRLQEDGFLRAERLIFTAPGIHETPRKLEKKLKKQLVNAKSLCDRVIVVYGAKCFMVSSNPLRDVDALISEQGRGISRIRASNCVDTLADAEERQAVAGGQSVYWLTPGRLRHWRYILRDWDRGQGQRDLPAERESHPPGRRRLFRSVHAGAS